MFNKYQYQEAKKFLTDHNAKELNSVEFDTWKATRYKLDNGEEWEEMNSKLESPKDDYSLQKIVI
jgi:hypothetical protein